MQPPLRLNELLRNLVGHKLEKLEANAVPVSQNEIQRPAFFSKNFVDFAIDDDTSEGDTNIDMKNNKPIKDENTGKFRIDASRGKLIV